MSTQRALPAPPQQLVPRRRRAGLRRLRDARVRPRPSPTPPLPGGRSPFALPQTTMPGTAASSGFTDPGAAATAAAAHCPRLGREEG